MYTVTIRNIPLLSALIILISSILLLINYWIFKFPGNNYFPDHVAGMPLIILTMYLGMMLTFGKNHRLSKSVIELLYLFMIMSIIALATNAVQLTPFPPIDHHLVSFEKALHINLAGMMEWTNKYPLIKKILTFTYDSLPYQMSFIPLLVMTSGRFYLLREYYHLLLTTTLLGFTFYYFFPTTAPASIINSPFFSPEQIATGFKFNQIHHYINPTTNEGGLIALPSFHTIWAVLLVYLIREWFIPSIILGIINGLLIISCVLLGWHYPIDIVAGFLLLGLSYYFLNLSKSD